MTTTAQQSRGTMPSHSDSEAVSRAKKILSATFFVASTIQLVVLHRNVTTLRYVYPPYQVFGMFQLLTTVAALLLARYLNWVQFPGLDRRLARRLYPLILLNFGSIVTGLNSFGIVDYTVYNMSHRIVILITITLLLESIFLDVRVSFSLMLIIIAMTVGAIVSGADDIHSFFDYIIILTNSSFTAGNRIYFKKVLDSRELGVTGLLYYSTLITLIPPALLSYFTGSLNVLNLSILCSSIFFWLHLFLTTIMSSMISWSMILCILCNGALATAIIGSLVNVLLTILMYVESLAEAYVVHTESKTYESPFNKISWNYCLGWSILITASFVYLYSIFKTPSGASNKYVEKNDDTIRLLSVSNNGK